MSGVFQNIDPPTSSPPGECVPSRLWCGGRTHSLGGEGVGGSIFWKMPDTALYSTYVVSTLRDEHYICLHAGGTGAQPECAGGGPGHPHLRRVGRQPGATSALAKKRRRRSDRRRPPVGVRGGEENGRGDVSMRSG